jgi:hypothetical protein
VQPGHLLKILTLPRIRPEAIKPEPVIREVGATPNFSILLSVKLLPLTQSLNYHSFGLDDSDGSRDQEQDFNPPRARVPGGGS